MPPYVIAAQHGDVDEMWRALHECFATEHVTILAPDDILERACSRIVEFGTPDELAIMMPHFDGKHLNNALSWAGWKNRRDLIDIMMNKAEPIGLRQCFDNACYEGHKELVLYLMPHIDFSTPEWSPLEEAASGGHMEIVRLLLDKCDPNNKGGEALVKAIINQHMDIVDLLLPLTDLIRNRGEALYQAIGIQSEELVARLLPSFDFKQDGDDLINNAIRNNNTNIFRMLIDHGGARIVRNNPYFIEKTLIYGSDDVIDLILDLHTPPAQILLLQKVKQSVERQTNEVMNLFKEPSLSNLLGRLDALQCQHALTTQVVHTKPTASKSKM